MNHVYVIFRLLVLSASIIGINIHNVIKNLLILLG